MFSMGSYFCFILSLPFSIYLSFSSSFSSLFLLACPSIWPFSTSWNSARPKRPFCKSPITYDHGLIKCTNMKKSKLKVKAIKSISSQKSSAHRLMLSSMSEAPGVSLKRTNYFYFHLWQNLQSQHLSSNLWIPSGSHPLTWLQCYSFVNSPDFYPHQSLPGICVQINLFLPFFFFFPLF